MSEMNDNVQKAARYIQGEFGNSPLTNEKVAMLNELSKTIRESGMGDIIEAAWRIFADTHHISVAQANEFICPGVYGKEPITLKVMYKMAVSYGYIRAARDSVSEGLLGIEQRKMDWLLKKADTTLEYLDTKFANIDKRMARIQVGTVMWIPDIWPGEYFKQVVTDIKNTNIGLIQVVEPGFTGHETEVKERFVDEMFFSDEIGMKEG